jgi:hypothetical protein
MFIRVIFAGRVKIVSPNVSNRSHDDARDIRKKMFGINNLFIFIQI